MSTDSAAVDLYWIPPGAGGLVVFSLVLLVATMCDWDRFRPYHPTTLLWLVAELVRETECHRDLVSSGILWAVLLSPVTGLILYLGGWGGIGHE